MVITKFVLRMHVQRHLTYTKKLDMRRIKSHSSLVFYMCIAGCIPIENTLIGVDHRSLLYITVPTADYTGWVKTGWIFRTVRSYQKYIALDSAVLGPIFCLHLMHKHIRIIGTVQRILPLQQIKILKNVEGIKLKLIHWFKWSTSLLLDISLKVLCFRKIWWE